MSSLAILFRLRRISPRRQRRLWHHRRLVRWLPASADVAILAVAVVYFAVGNTTVALSAEGAELIAHWPLAGDARDATATGCDGEPHGVQLRAAAPAPLAGHAARFDGRDDWLGVRNVGPLQVGSGDFSVACWLHTADGLDDVLGDIVSHYDPATRTGWMLSIQDQAGGTSSHANHRHVTFSVVPPRATDRWIDCGRPGRAVLVYALAVYNGSLFAGTCVAGRDEAGRVFRYADDGQWIDCGAPDRCNAVSAMAVYEGKLFAAVSKYRLRGSSLAESENPHRGGKVYRYEGGKQWVCVGTLPDVEAINGMVVFRGKLYASSMYARAGLFRYDGENTWTNCGSPNGKRVEALCVYNGSLMATGYDEGGVYRYDGQTWQHCGRLGDNTQTYSFAIHYGRLYVGTWPSGRVYRYDADQRWTDVGRLGNELEVMGMAVYNGSMYGGTLPLAEVYRYQPPNRWTRVGRVDHTPDVRYRRAWTMALFNGRLYVGTLPSAHVWSLEAGRSVMLHRPLPSGWVHLAAVKQGGRMKIYLNGHVAAESGAFEPANVDLSNPHPLTIGFGPNDYFNGYLRDVRLYRGALSPEEVARLAKAARSP